MTAKREIGIQRIGNGGVPRRFAWEDAQDEAMGNIESQPRVVAECWTCCPAGRFLHVPEVIASCRVAGHDVREVKP